MASKKSIELKEFTVDELTSEIKEVQLQYTKLRFDHAIKGIANPLELREIRRDLARLKTEARKREVAEMSPEQIAKRSRIRARR